jgi:hypothetical protein
VLMDKYRSNVIIDAGQEFISPESAETEEGRVTWANASKNNVGFFRDQGYQNPLEIMANFQGRDLYGLIEYGEEIRAADTVVVDGEPQTMFGWQAYWGTEDQWYQSYQGALLLGQDGATITAAEAMDQFVATSEFPIQVGIDNISGDTNLDYADEIDRAAANDISWLWWSWRDGSVECPVSGATCESYVTTGENGFAGARPLGH